MTTALAALVALLALALAGTASAADKDISTPVYAKASALSKRQIQKLIRKEARKHPGPQGPQGPAGPAGPQGPAGASGAGGTARSDAIIYRAAFGAGVQSAYAKNGITILMNCNVDGTMRIRTGSDNAAIGNFGLTGALNTFGGLSGDFDSGPAGELDVTPIGQSAIGTMVYTPAGGNPVTINYNVQFGTAQENCILTGTATYS